MREPATTCATSQSPPLKASGLSLPPSFLVPWPSPYAHSTFLWQYFRVALLAPGCLSRYLLPYSPWCCLDVLPLTHATALKPLATSEVAQMEPNSDKVEKQREKQQTTTHKLSYLVSIHDMPRAHNPGPSTLHNRNRVTNKTRFHIIQGTLDLISTPWFDQLATKSHRTHPSPSQHSTSSNVPRPEKTLLVSVRGYERSELATHKALLDKLRTLQAKVEVLKGVMEETSAMPKQERDEMRTRIGVRIFN
ncbi:hypothetical protein V8E53_009869 [Lactarius tabidus]